MKLPWGNLLEPVPDDPFYQPRRPLTLPRQMAVAPSLPENGPTMRTVRRKLTLLVNPFYAKSPHGSFGKHVLTPSLALTSIAAATPAAWEVRYWDENLLQGPPPCDPVPEVTGITVHLTFAERAYALARWFRSRGSRVILGGLHVQSCPEEAATHADAIVIGDGVQLWPRVLADVEQGALRPRYEAPCDRAFDLEPWPRRELASGPHFLTTASVIATRGCRNRCSFCYLATKGVRQPYRARRVEQVCAEIRASGQPYVVFLDNNLVARPDYLRNLCRGLKELNIIWSAAVTLDITDEPGLVRDMAQSGCNGVFIGFESVRASNLVRARKQAPPAEDWSRRVRLLHNHGISVNGSFVLGFDDDDQRVFPETAAWIEQNRLECSTFHILTPYPGTPLFRQLEAEGRLLHRDWARYDTAHVVFQPKRMSAEELALGYDWLYRRLFSSRSIWLRRPASVAGLLPYLGISLLYKRSNWLWQFLIQHGLVHAVWHPLVAWTRWRHLRRRGCQANEIADPAGTGAAEEIVPAEG